MSGRLKKNEQRHEYRKEGKKWNENGKMESWKSKRKQKVVYELQTGYRMKGKEDR